MTPEALEVFKQLTIAFTTTPVLVYYDLEALICLKTDALGFRISRILSQSQDDPDATPSAANVSEGARKGSSEAPQPQQH